MLTAVRPVRSPRMRVGHGDSPCARRVVRVRRGVGVAARGMTLIEILVVMVIIVLVTGGVLLGSGQTSSSRLKQSAALVSGAVRLAFSRANTSAKAVRLAFDMENDTLALEESDGAMLVQSGDRTGTGGAAAQDGAEQAAVQESKRILEGPTPPRPQFRGVDDVAMHTSDPGKKGPRKLPAGITIRSVQTAHDDAPRTEHRAYLYFWPGGQTEQAAIQLAIGATPDDSQIYTLTVAPLTGRVTITPGAHPLVVPTEEKDQQERQAPGSF